MPGTDNIVSKAKEIWRWCKSKRKQYQLAPPPNLHHPRVEVVQVVGWCKLWGGGSSLGSGPVMNTVSTDGVEDTGESIEIESGDDHT